jgi:hypothetical protein
MSAPDDPGFSEAHVRAILGRAIEVDARAPTVNRDDLYGVAAELGITPGTRRDPAIVRSAQHSAMGWVRVRRTGRGGYSGGHGRGGASLADHYYASHRRMGGLDNRGRGGGRDPESACPTSSTGAVTRRVASSLPCAAGCSGWLRPS